MTKRTAILDVNLIKVARKYAAKTEEFNTLNEAYSKMDSEFAERENDLLAELYDLRSW